MKKVSRILKTSWTLKNDKHVHDSVLIYSRGEPTGGTVGGPLKQFSGDFKWSSTTTFLGAPCCIEVSLDFKAVIFEQNRASLANAIRLL